MKRRFEPPVAHEWQGQAGVGDAGGDHRDVHDGGDDDDGGEPQPQQAPEVVAGVQGDVHARDGDEHEAEETTPRVAMSPSSSPVAAKMKSVCGKGR